MYQTCCWFCDDIWWMEDSFHLFRKYLITGLWCSHIQQCRDIWHWIFEGPKDQGEGTCSAAFHRSLSNLDCQYLDLYLIHWPGTQGKKPDDPDQGELRVGSWRDLIKLQKEGTMYMYDMLTWYQCSRSHYIQELCRNAHQPCTVKQCGLFTCKNSNSWSACALNILSKVK